MTQSQTREPYCGPYQQAMELAALVYQMGGSFSMVNGVLNFSPGPGFSDELVASVIALAHEIKTLLHECDRYNFPL